MDAVMEFDDGSWVYLGIDEADRSLRQALFDACHANGWPAVSGRSLGVLSESGNSGEVFEGIAHAVEHADVVIVALDGSSGIVDAELAFAYRHNRPIIAVISAGAQVESSPIRSMLRGYGRSFVVERDESDSWLAELRMTFGSSVFAQAVQDAAGESSSYG
ncbi:MAG: hypothetical protein ACRDPE_18610 [Solirubrobacterales bacterium]